MLKVLNHNDAGWDEIVRSFKDHDIYYLSGYVNSLYVNGDGMPLLFCYEKDGFKAMQVMLKRDIADDERFEGRIEKGTCYDLISPYGYGGWIFEGDADKKSLFEEYDSWCAEHHIISEFVRFHPLIDNYRYSQDHYEVIPLGRVIAMDCSDKDLIWSNMSSNNRNKIKRAKNLGIQIRHGGKEMLEDFISLYEMTMERNNATDYYFFNRDYYDTLTDCKDNCLIFEARTAEGELISSAMVLSANDKASYHLSGSRRMPGNLCENNLLLYEAALWANENGFRTFLLGGGLGSSEDNLYKFKLGFNKKESHQFYIGKKIHDRTIYDELVAMREDIANHGFFPEYRG